MTTVDVFVIDPPWPQYKGGLRSVRPKQGRKLPYKTLSLGAIQEILHDDILPQASERHVVFLWTVDKFLRESEDMMAELGYKLHARFIWNKTNGVAPAFTVRYTHEYLLWYYKAGRMLKITPSVRGKWTTVFTERQRQHSRKPDIAYEMISDFYPTATKMDVFSREPREGWLQWGDQPNYFRE